MKYLILSAIFGALIISSMLTDKWLDGPDEVGYTPAQVHAVDEFVAKQNAQPIRFRPMSATERRSALSALYLGGKP